MVANADVIVGFETYPHVDMYETGERAARLAVRTLAGEIKPKMAWCRAPMMTHTLRVATERGAMRRCIERARAAEREGMLSASVLPGFALADIPAPCFSAIAIADGDPARASSCAERITRAAWDERGDFVYRSEGLSDSIRRARETHARGGGPILLLDHGDNCMSGGTCDDMEVLRAALDQGMENILAGPLCDPQAVAELFDAGQGATVTVAVGNKIPIGSARVRKDPLSLKGRVVALAAQGRFTVTGPTYTGETLNMGRTALFDTGRARLVIVERTQEPLDVGVFACIGADVSGADYLLLKSRMYCRPVFEPLARGVVECDGRGATSSDYGLFEYKRLMRPVFPLDPSTYWQ
jgi:microcystin degradation protein MlrC